MLALLSNLNIFGILKMKSFVDSSWFTLCTKYHQQRCSKRCSKKL
ncbi:hypothetical protein CORMATOL_01223 [Corynebacterium matruchotii ATCC 33806]|uniref:Uncharacterized protein n=1 Tax=Corynebacterium matruchotii ATCC 33806 TaxID=566549 RepID=C0E2L8_9CORY|nr:hypothetical protein CORMATOL_01223 [Corynebacterium matruchotii ATCC 33806]